MSPVNMLASIFLVLLAIGWITGVVLFGGFLSLVFLASSDPVAVFIGLLGLIMTTVLAVGPVLLLGRSIK